MSEYGVTAEDIRAAAYGVTIPTGEPIDNQLDRLIVKAEMLLPTVCIDRQIAAGTLAAEKVMSVVEDMVVRVTKNAAGYRQRTIEDYSVTLDTAISSGALYLADDERRRLCPAVKRSGRVGSVRLGVPAHRLPGRSV